ncbi:hypothetical protein D918_07099 [Trichuris suis]|nr:hypothetical protein D918_07099 [Trichuris suis]
MERMLRTCSISRNHDAPRRVLTEHDEDVTLNGLTMILLVKPGSEKTRTELRTPFEFHQGDAINEVKGKLHFDFKNPEAVLTLTKTLLEKDFGLFVDIPSDSLVPRIPGRLNYLLWLQDLMEENFKDEHIHCIDIGTGASCIYPLLGVKVCGWKFLAIESLSSNVDFARKNVERNSLQHVITVVHVAKDQSLYDVINSFEFPYFHFWMCNPPFFDTDEPEGSRSVIPRDPHSATVGKPEEMRTEGGEVRFVTRLIDESVKLNMKIRIYTSMLGRKISLRPVMDKLRSSGVASMCQTTFSQGKTQRWAVAWTFDKDVKLKDTSKTKAKRKDKKASYGFSVPEAALQPYTMNSFCEWLERLFSECSIKYAKVESSEALTRYAAEAMTNTWIGCRRKRRAAKQSLRQSDAKKPKVEGAALFDFILRFFSVVDDYLEPVDGMHSETASTSARSYCCDTPSSGKPQCPPVSSQCGTAGQSESPNKIAKEYSLPREEKQDGHPILKFEVAVQASASSSLDVNFIFVFGQTPDLLHQLMQYSWNRLADCLPRTLSSHTSVCNDNPSCT